ncbi:MAG: transposase [Nocardioides sp.]|nr:transposase [Nocardioides sp.]
MGWSCLGRAGSCTSAGRSDSVRSRSATGSTRRIRRYEYEHTGDPIHVELKRPGRNPDGEGWRHVGQQQSGRTARRPLTRGLGRGQRRWNRGTATDVVCNAVAWFADRGVMVHGALSDNGSCSKSNMWRTTCAEPGHHAEEDSGRPTRDQREDRASTAPWGRGLGLQEARQLRISPNHRSARMSPSVQPPPAPLAIGTPAPMARLSNLAGHHSQCDRALGDAPDGGSVRWRCSANPPRRETWTATAAGRGARRR